LCAPVCAPICAPNQKLTWLHHKQQDAFYVTFVSAAKNFTMNLLKSALLIFAASLSSIGISQNFSNWSNYEFYSVTYLSNTWSTTASSLSNMMKYDAWEHVEKTKNFLSKKVGYDKILPANIEDWPQAALDNRHRVLFIEIWSDGVYRMTDYGPAGTSYTFWRFRDMTHIMKLRNNPKYTGNLALEEFKHSAGINVKRDHVKIQEKWDIAHRYHNFSYNENYESAMLRDLEELGYSPSAATLVPSEMTGINADSLKTLVQASTTECIVGLYRLAPGSPQQCGYYRFGVIEYEGELTAIINKDLESNGNPKWKEGEIKARFTRTAAPSYFITDWKMGNRSDQEGYAECETGILSITIEAIGGSDDNICNYIKTFPLESVSTNSAVSVAANIGEASGAGSAVVVDDRNQFIVTNYHVVDGASSFAVEQGGKLFKAVLLKTDENNDLALLRIIEEGIELQQIPISMDDKLGDRVYSAGYPRVFEMGDEIKITEGVISSMSFLSDPSKFQTSVPITNGNSGGALLDESGNLVGITQGGWRPDANTENVNAAVKSLYIISLAQTEATCTLSLSQSTSKIDFSEIENSVLPIFVYK
jgi:hypothetical protein